MAPKQSRLADAGSDLALRQQLAAIKRVPLEQVGRIRMTPDKMPSLVDVGVILTGKAARHVADDLQTIMRKHSDLSEKVGRVSFGGRGGNRDSLVPKDLPALIEIIFLLPGRAAAQVRQEAAKIFVRHFGGDLSLIPEVERMNHVQAFLRENAPEHPLRAFGEAVEHGQFQGSVSQELERAEMEMTLGHKRRMLDLEYDTAQKKARAEVCKSEAETQIVQAETRKTQVEMYVSCFETVARLGVVPDDRVRLQLRDLVGSEIGQVSQLQRKEISIRGFLLSKKVNPKVHEVAFGKQVAKLKREDLRAKGLSEVLPTKTIESNGQVVSAKLYFEEDMPFFEAAWMNLRGVGCDSEVSNTLATAFMRSQAT